MEFGEELVGEMRVVGESWGVATAGGGRGQRDTRAMWELLGLMKEKMR